MKNSHSNLIGLWPSVREFAHDLDVSQDRVRKWRDRGCIPAENWPIMIAAARRRRIKGVTIRVLLDAIGRKVETK